MGTYNILRTEIECPRCKLTAEQEVFLYFGYTSELLEFKLGDKYVWRHRKSPDFDKSPNDGSEDNEGYVVCELCKKDFFVKVEVKNDILVNVDYDSIRKPYIED